MKRISFCRLLLLAALLAFGPLAHGATQIITDAALLGTNTWYRTNTYVLAGLVHVRDGAVLNIEAGTVIRGSNTGPSAVQQAGLVVCRGGKLFAHGTPHNPIIFTAMQDDVLDPEDMGIYQRGLWGGVILMGRAPLNAAVSASGNTANPIYEVFEGLPDTQLGGEFVHRYGGGDADDSSGVMRYVSIRHGGAVIEANRELNGLSLCGVGRGTTIEFVECYAIADDGFEFFGGSVNTRYLVSSFNDDDAFDADQGHHGKHQFWFGIQPPDKRNYGYELNGEPSGLTGANPRAPFSAFTVFNATSIGAGVGNAGTGGDNTAFKIREFSAPSFQNSIFTDFARRGVEIDAKSGLFLTNGTLQFANNLWWGFTGGADPNSATNLAVDTRAQVLFTESARSNAIVNPQLRGISRTNNGALDPRPAAGSPAWTSAIATVPNDGFFTQTAYLGAFGNVNWASDWSALGEYAVLTGAGAGVPSVAVPAPTPSSPTLAFAAAGGDIQITFTSQTGVNYQLQSATVLTGAAGGWTNEGAAVAGTGGPLTMTPPIAGAQKFFRVVVP